jgi:hypothetical protein
MGRSIGCVLLLITACGTARADSDWLGLRNDTDGPLIVQEIILVKNQVRRGPSQKLLPGESAFEAKVVPSSKRVVIFDPRDPDRLLYQGDVVGAFYSIRPDSASRPGRPALGLTRAESAKPTASIFQRPRP